MNCQEMALALPEYIDGSLNRAGREAVEDHLDACGECRELLDLWERLGELPEPVPGPHVRARFQKALAAETSPPGRVLTIRLPRARWAGFAAAAAGLVFAGWMGGRYWAAPTVASETATLREEVRGLRSLVAVSLLSQQSASDRLKGINYAGRLRESSPDVLDALVQALKFDSNVNVRLAACEALRSHGRDAEVRRAFIEALDGEDSALAKVALIDAVSGLPDSDGARALARLASSRDEDVAVQRRAARALDQFREKGIRWE